MTAIPGWTPSVIQLNPFAQAYVDEADIQIAPWIMGTFADLFLQGILATQTVAYFTHPLENPTSHQPSGGNALSRRISRRRFSTLVIVLTILCLLKTAQNIVIVWDTVITNFANPDVSMILVGVLWSHYTTSLSTAIIATLVQAFFVYRYWMLTRRLYVCAVMILSMVVSLIAASLVIFYISRIDHVRVKQWSLVHFVAAIIVDFLITSLTALHLYKQKASMYSNSVTSSQIAGESATPMFTSTAAMIDRLIRLTFQSALPPTLLVIVNAIVLEALPLELTHIAVNIPLPKLYAISLLYTLNCRNEIRSERTTGPVTSHTVSHQPAALSHVHSQRQVGSFSPRKHSSFLPATHSFGGTEIRGSSDHPYGRAERSMSPGARNERGLSISKRGRRGGSVGRRLEGIHVETQVSRDVDLEMDDFAGTTSKGRLGTLEDEWEVARDREEQVWDGKGKKGEV